MKNETKFKFSDYFKLPNDGLRAFLHHVKEGNDTVIRTPLFNGKDPKRVLDSWQKILEPKIKYEGLLNFENDLRSKVGPLSIRKPLSERMGDIESYYESIYLDSTPVSNEAILRLLKDWRPKIGGLRFRSYPETWLRMQKSTNSGAPYFRKRRVIEKEHGLGVTVYSRPGYSKTKIPDDASYVNTAILGWRGQEGGPEDDDVKQRVIWMFPMYVNLAELSFYQPFIEACQKSNLVPAWNGNDYVDREMTKLFDTKGKDDLVIATDFTKFDQHFNRDLQRCAFNMFWFMTNGKVDLSSNTTIDWWHQIFPIKYNIPLCYEWGSVRTGVHGMASGSGGTNADETFVHKCLQYEAALEHDSELNPHSMCLGDDGIISYPGISIDQVLESYTKHGLEMNESKQFAATDETTYLRRWHHKDYRINGVCAGVYSTYRALGKLMYQERFYGDWSKEMVILRAWSIIENCKYHPAREEFLDYCIEGDYKYHLGLRLPGGLSKMVKSAKSAMERMQNNFMSYTQVYEKQGIETWWVYNALKARA